MQVQAQEQVGRGSSSNRRGVNVPAVERFLGNRRMRQPSETCKIPRGHWVCGTPGVDVHARRMGCLSCSTWRMLPTVGEMK